MWALLCTLAAAPLKLSAQRKSDTLSINLSTPPPRNHPLDATRSAGLRNPAKAALYSSVLPGLGQAYNRKYWKIPLVYALIGTSAYFIKYNNDRYRRLRKAFSIRINGRKDEFQDALSLEQIADRAREYERDRNLAMVFTTGFYMLNILDALVDAQLSSFTVDKSLSLQPILMQSPDRSAQQPGLALCFSF